MAEQTVTAAAAPEAPRSMRTFFIIWGGQLVSIMGSGLTSFALGVWIFNKTGQATPFALTALFSMLPRILLSPLGGSLADRCNRRWLMILSDAAAALVTGAAAVLLYLGDLQIWHIYLMASIGSILGAFQEPAYMSSVTMLVPRQHLARASGMMQTASSLTMIVSPMLAGVLFGVIGLRGILVIDFVTCFFAVGALLLVRIPQPPVVETPGTRTDFLSDARFGWRYLLQRRGLMVMLLYFALVNFLLNLAMVLMAPLVLSYGDASTLGLVQAISGLGMLAGSIAISAWGGPKDRIPAILIFLGTAGLGLGMAGVYPSALATGGGLFLMMAMIPLASGCSQAIYQSKIEPGVQGRVFAIRGMITQSIMPLAFLLAGPLSDFVFESLLLEGGGLADTFIASLLGTGPGRGTGLIFVLSGLTLVAASMLVGLNPRLRRVETELPDAVPAAAD